MISQRAFDLIVAEEVTSKDVYKKKYEKPEWPRGSSGVTVGIGYDLGHTAPETIKDDWIGVVPNAMLSIMVRCSGVRGDAAKKLTHSVYDKINIKWDQAIKVHAEKVIPRWEKSVRKTLPNCDLLNEDQFGCLVSLAYNRGVSGFVRDGDRFKEMNNIYFHMKNKQFHNIPDEFRAMKRLWPDLKGLRTRRENEARLFEESS